MDCIHCPQCYAYAYDTLVRPASRARVDIFENTVSIPRIAKAAHTLTPDFIRASVTPGDLSYIVILCVEAGGVIPPKNRKRDAFAIMWLWMQNRLLDLGNMSEIHFNHSGGFAPELPPPAPSLAPLGPLRIRIPRCPDGLYD
jgi:hypothetical protein